MAFYEHYVCKCAEINKSPSKVALEIGLSKTAVNGWKTGKSKPTDATLQKIASYFGITVAELLGEEQKKTATVGDDLSEDEIKLIKHYSKADEQKKAAIRILLGM